MKAMVRYFDCGCSRGHNFVDFCSEGEVLERHYRLSSQQLLDARDSVDTPLGWLEWSQAKYQQHLAHMQIHAHYAAQIREAKFEDVILEEVKCPDTPEALLKLSAG